MSTEQQLQEQLKIPVTKVNVGDGMSRVYSTNGIYAGSLPTQKGPGSAGFDTSEDALSRLHWETIYITHKPELSELAMALFPRKVYLSLSSFRKLHIRDENGEDIAMVECFYDGQWRVREINA